ncbi:MAG: helix-turn-helix transcriptional regulator [Bacteroidota bacterium]|nr:helix-turn-helix transcriptional regulator [Bacteroidota bacterium]
MKKEELQKIIGNRIRLLRESKGVSQQVLAAMCNFEKGNMSRIEAGRTNPTFTTLYKISQALGIKITDLVDFE